MHQVELDLENAVRELSLCECPANVRRKDLFIGGNAWRLVVLESSCRIAHKYM